MKIAIKSRWTRAVLFEAEIEARYESEPHSIQLGAAVKVAVKARADLTDADLAGADLAGAYLTDADLTGANLAGADLTDADLTGANLAGADLARADLAGANLTGAYLTGANLAGANLTDAKNAELAMAMTVIAPREGEIIGWKKAHSDGGEPCVVKLRIPPEAKRSNGASRKCRAEYVEVLDIEGAEVAFTNQHGPKTEYRVGEIVRPDSWDDDRWNECSHGIHFFLTREEAAAW